MSKNVSSIGRRGVHKIGADNINVNKIYKQINKLNNKC